MKTKKIALLIDVDNVKIGKEATLELFEKLEEIGDVVYCKFYGYNDRKHIYLSDLILNYGYETAPFMRLKKRFSQLDNRMVVDAVKLNYTKPEINTFCIVAGNGDLIPALVELKSCGKTVIDVNTEYQEINKHMFDEHIALDNIGDEAEVYGAKTKQPKVAKTAPKVVSKPETVQTKEEPVKPQPKPEKVETKFQPQYEIPSFENLDEEEGIEEEEKEEKVPYTKSNLNYQTPKSNNNYGGNYQDDELDNYIEDELYEEPDEYDLSDVLQDITERYNELDFSNNENMPEKLKLIEDIENLIEAENNKGEGMNSSNSDMRQIFNDLQEIVDEMKSAL